jgi:CheY-like chemotaxis protein
MVSGILNDISQSLSEVLGFLELAELALDDGELGHIASLRVLVVEESASLRGLMLTVLHRAGHDVDAVSSGTAALARLQSATFDVVLCDLSLYQELNGWDLARTIAEHWPGVGFILVTGSPDNRTTEHLECAGIDAVLTRPFLGRQLREVVARVGMVHPRQWSRDGW